jgi:hypothetical protein
MTMTKAMHRRTLCLLAGFAAGALCQSAYALHQARIEVQGSGFFSRDTQPIVASGSGANTSNPNLVNDAFARADVRGLLQVQAETSGDGSHFSVQGAHAFAELIDTLTFSGPGLVTLTLTVDGTFSNDPHAPPNDGGNGISQLVQATLFADLGGPTAKYAHAEQRDGSDNLVVEQLCFGNETTCTPNTSGPGFEVQSSGTENSWHAVLKRSFLADADHNFTYGVHATLNLNVAESGNGRLVNADLAHSATLGIELAPGMTFTSESGVFLAPVPEPAEWEELAVAMLALAAVVRTRRGKRRVAEADRV